MEQAASQIDDEYASVEEYYLDCARYG